MDDKLVILFGDKRKSYDLERCHKHVIRIFKNVGDDVICAPNANGVRLMTREEQFQLFG